MEFEFIHDIVGKVSVITTEMDLHSIRVLCKYTANGEGFALAFAYHKLENLSTEQIQSKLTGLIDRKHLPNNIVRIRNH